MNDIYEQLLAAEKPKEPHIAQRSETERYATCPLQGHLCETLKLDDPSEARDVGIEAHKAVAATLKEAIEQNLPPDSGPTMASDFLYRILSARPDIQPQILRAARHIADQFGRIRLERVIGVEMVCEALTDIMAIDGRPYKLVQEFDLVCAGRDSLIVTDWKTGWKAWTNTEARDAFQTQHGSYVLWAQYPDIKVHHWFYMDTRRGKIGYACMDRNAIVQGDVTLRQAIKARVFETLKLKAEGCQDAWPEPKKCSFCPAISHCSHAVPFALDIAGNPAAFVDRMVVLQAVLKRMDGTIKDYWRKHGPVVGSEAVFDWLPNFKVLPNLHSTKEAEAEGEQ